MMFSDSDISSNEDGETGVSEQLYESGESSGDDGDVESDFDNESNLIGLRGYDHEPKRKLNSSNASFVDSDVAISEVGGTGTNFLLRIDNTDWCGCGNCTAMSTWEESTCCREYDAISNEKMEGKIA